MSRQDLTDPATFAKWLDGLRTTVDDLDGAVLDMLRPPRKRQLGHVTHRAIVKAARAQLRSALAYAAPDPEDGEPSDPAGLGGAGPD